jgi:hypothetical protein
MHPDAYRTGGRSYPVSIQLMYSSTYSVGFPKCPRRNPCAECYRRGSWWK